MAKRVLIIGSGVIGLCAAYYAARDGHSVTVLDRRDATHEGCSYGNAGMIVPSHFVPLAAPGMVALGLKWMWNPKSPFYIKPRFDADLFSWGFKFWQAATRQHVERAGPLLRDLSFASRACFEELAALPGSDFGLVKRGLLMLCKTQHTLDDEAKMAEEARRLGVPAEVLDAKQTAALDPNVRMDVAGAIHFPKDCHLSPGRFMANLKQHLAAYNVKFLWDTEVTGFARDDRNLKSVQTSNADVEADEFVIAGGSWSPVIVKELGLKLPMQAGKGYSVTLLKPRQLPDICAIFSEARIAVTPMGSSLRFGGTMEIAGLNETINPVRVRGIVESVPKYYPEFQPSDFDNVKPWCGLRPCSPDGLPYIGRTQKFQNLCVATGHAMMGLSLGPVTGKIISDALANRKPGFDLTLLDPDRYA
jgi:D-amino-acid dehydrogenase